MSITATVLTLVFIGLTILLSLWQRLGLERDLLIGTIRAAVQLTLVGYVLLMVFELRDWPYIVLMVMVMILVAAQNAARRGNQIPQVFWKVLAAITATEVMAMLVMLGLEIIPPTPQYVIPISGMVVGNAMIVAGLLLNRLQAEIEAGRQQIMVALSLGATARQAVLPVLRKTVRAGTIPIIDNLKTVGLVQLPGMMTGLIIAGVSPEVAVRWQLLIMFSLTAVSAVCAIVLAFLTYPALFTPAHQLREPGRSRDPAKS